jgi:hypothetical protein
MIRFKILTFLFGALALVFGPLANTKEFTCDCPTPFNHSDTICAPTPRRVEIIEKALPKVTRDPLACGKEGSYSGIEFPLSRVGELKSVSRAIETSTSHGMKSYKDTIDYASCYRDVIGKGDQKDATLSFCEFRDKLAPLIMLSAQASGLPFAVESCLFKRESEFSRSVTSPVGAKSYGQFMPSTITQINHALFDEQVPDPSDPKNKKIYKFLPFSQLEMDLKNAQQDFRRAEKNAGIHSIELSSKKKALDELYTKWQSRKIWEIYWSGTPQAPKSATPHMISCPNAIFVLANMKEVSEIYNGAKFDPFNMKPKTLPTWGHMDSFETAVAITGSYDMNPDAFKKKCSNARNLDECIAAIPYKETREQMKNIRRCATANDWKPGSGQAQDRSDCKIASCFR